MKNLLIYANPSRDFIDYHWGDENKALAKIQIDNSLALGWKREDIILMTNFPYEYQGVRSIVVDNLFCDISYNATKILGILHLFDQGLIGNDLWWFHDFDAFQLEPITEAELELGNHVFALTDYGKTTLHKSRDRRWSTGSIFFNKDAEHIFRLIEYYLPRYKANEEVLLLLLTNQNKDNINEKIKKLNITYNLATRKRDILACWEMADKPLKVIHFHPSDKRKLDLEGDSDNIAACVHGKSRIKRPLINQRLKNLFTKYKII
jgi:hypothetical protein